MEYGQMGLEAAVNSLFESDIGAIIEAVRRDMHAEQDKVDTDKEWADDHAYNVRKDRRILEALNPKSIKWRG